MKKYEKPFLMEEEIEIEDVIASSSGGVTKDTSTTNGDEGFIGLITWGGKK